ncbi:arylsulfatase [Halalkaliarchaeum desulfuricum]|uniref:Arylsulfatase n=1 Tax=Halalkaliarchaeum desulfuricum TaxID=2055893 RepID=A0A343TP50_9EURY|nr:sulfatase [Halalkaliarchaeum desulfuricum]AUX10872.1 arylsulfatase [Halalkaliarchaeum desulfuricum]
MSDADAVDNVLFVVLDTVRADHLTPYGYDRETTPTLERFAAESTVFEEAVAPAPWTLPVHASLFTGLYPHQHGADQETPYLEGEVTLAETLSAAGYDTACYSSNAWITPYTRLTDGFDDRDNFFQAMPGDFLSGPLARAWKRLNDDDRLRSVANRLVAFGNSIHEYLASGGGSDSKTPRAIDCAREFIERSEADSSPADPGWFVFCNLMDAHLPYHPPEKYAGRFAPGVDSTSVCQNSKEYNAGAREIDDEEWEAIRGLYDAEIAHMDAELGRLFGWLRETGRWEDTAVVVCADHGELHGEHDLYGHEFSLYDPLVNVPLLVKHPKLGTGRRDDLVELLDLYHTVLDVLDVDPEAVGIPGDDGGVPLDPTRSLLSEKYRAFEGIDAPDPGQSAVLDRRKDGDDADYAFIEYAQPVVELTQLENKANAAGIALERNSRFYARMRAARSTDAKYVRADRIPDEAYRIDRDPGETRNLAGPDFDSGCDSADGSSDASTAELIAGVEAALASFEEAAGGRWTVEDADDLTSLGESGVEEMDETAQQRLRDLGYLE